MMYNVVQRFKSDFSLADIGMSVFGGAPDIFTVIDMEDGNLIFADESVNCSMTPSSHG